MIPPAFAEIGQLMLERVLQKFEANAHYITQPIVTDYERFEPPAKKMGGHKTVHFILEYVQMYL